MTPAGKILKLKRLGLPVPEKLKAAHRRYMREHQNSAKQRKRRQQQDFHNGRFLYHYINIEVPAWWLVGGR